MQKMRGHMRELFQPGLLYPLQKAVSPLQREVSAHLSARHLDPPEYPGVPGGVRAEPLGQLEPLHTQWEDLWLRLGPRDPGAGGWPSQAGRDGKLPSDI